MKTTEYKKTMKTAKLKRNYLDNCTISTLNIEDLELKTVERPWLNNNKNISCIPSGEYLCKFRVSNKHGDCWELENKNVNVGAGKHRTAILIHSANFPSQLEGCIAPGLMLHPEKWGVASSRLAMNELFKKIGKNDFNLIIT